MQALIIIDFKTDFNDEMVGIKIFSSKDNILAAQQRGK